MQTLFAVSMKSSPVVLVIEPCSQLDNLSVSVARVDSEGQSNNCDTINDNHTLFAITSVKC